MTTKLTPEEIREVIAKLKPNGFEWGVNNPQEPYIRFIYDTDRDQVFLDSINFKNIFYPLFLTRTLEAITSNEDVDFYVHSGSFYIHKESNAFEVVTNYGDDDRTFPFGKDIDKAKEAVIRYVLKGGIK